MRISDWSSDVCSSDLHPRDIKLRLARELATRFHDAVAAAQAIAGWQAVVQGAADGQLDLLPLHELTVPADGLRIGALLSLAGLASSKDRKSTRLNSSH